jgi:predicted DNA-binding protein
MEKTHRAPRKSISFPMPILRDLKRWSVITGKDQCCIVIEAVESYLNSQFEAYLKTHAKKVILRLKEANQDDFLIERSE